MTSNKRQGPAWKKQMNKIPWSQQEKIQKKLEEFDEREEEL